MLLIKKLIESGFNLDKLPADLHKAADHLKSAEENQKTALLDKVVFDSISTLFPSDPAVQKVRAEDWEETNKGFATKSDESEVADKRPDLHTPEFGPGVPETEGAEPWFARNMTEKGITLTEKGRAKQEIMMNLAKAMGVSELRFMYKSEDAYTFELVGERPSADPQITKMQNRLKKYFRAERMGVNNVAVVHIPKDTLKNIEMTQRFPMLTPMADGGDVPPPPAPMLKDGGSYDAELEKGIEIEMEHKDVYDFLVSKIGTLPISEREFYAMIAKGHLREIPNYYTLLDEMEGDAKENVLLDREDFADGGEAEKFLGGGKLILDENEKKNKLLHTLQIVVADLHKLMDTRPLTQSEERLLWEARKILAVYTVKQHHPTYGPALMEYLRPTKASKPQPFDVTKDLTKEQQEARRKGRSIDMADGGEAGWKQIEQNEGEFETTMKYLGIPKDEWENYRQDFMADGGEAKKEKRYTVDVDFYLYANDDEDAKQKAVEFVRELRDKHDNQAQVNSIHETPFASMRSRELRDVPKYGAGGSPGYPGEPGKVMVEYRTKHGMEADLDVDSSLDIEEVRRVVEKACKPQEFAWFTYKGKKVENIN